MKSMPKPGVCRLGKGVTAGRTGFVARSRCTGKAVIGVTNWLSPKVSKPEMVWEVELNGKASAKPRSELRYSFKRNPRSEEHTSELQSLRHLVCRLLLEKKKKRN